MQFTEEAPDGHAYSYFSETDSFVQEGTNWDIDDPTIRRILGEFFRRLGYPIPFQ